jgi:hypothetical protein
LSLLAKHGFDRNLGELFGVSAADADRACDLSVDHDRHATCAREVADPGGSTVTLEVDIVFERSRCALPMAAVLAFKIAVSAKVAWPLMAWKSTSTQAMSTTAQPTICFCCSARASQASTSLRAVAGLTCLRSMKAGCAEAATVKAQAKNADIIDAVPSAGRCTKYRRALCSHRARALATSNRRRNSQPSIAPKSP